MTAEPAQRAGLATGLAAGSSGIATLLVGGHLSGTYARVLVVVVALTALAAVIAAFGRRLDRARNIAGFMLWLLAGIAFGHATEPGVGLIPAITGMALVLPAGALAGLAIRFATLGVRTELPQPVTVR